MGSRQQNQVGQSQEYQPQCASTGFLTPGRKNRRLSPYGWSYQFRQLNIDLFEAYTAPFTDAGKEGLDFESARE